MKQMSGWVAAFGLLALFSCIREEAPNAEADILTCIVPGDVLKVDPEIENETVTLTVKGDADISRLAPEFTLTPGATISPASGTAFDFSTPQKYVVTSEDRNWTKTYTVRCIVSGVSTEYHFEQVTLEPTNHRYQIFYDILENGDSVTWASGNGGFALTNNQLGMYEFPTMQDNNGYLGKCAKLVTCSTGDFGSMFGMPIAAGNLYIGTFDILNAIPDARKGTLLGRPFEHVPAFLSGYYKYKAGEVYKKNGEPMPGMKDQCDIYAIFYETDDKVKYLDGFNGLTSPNLVSVARIENQQETDEWTHFYIPFVTRPGRTVDPDKLARGEYKLGIIFSSSIHGDTFEGAEGSTLFIDEVEVVCAEE
ncbi:MAG: PCMD domain-containing protein [Parabacteroides sp.]